MNRSEGHRSAEHPPVPGILSAAAGENVHVYTNEEAERGEESRCAFLPLNGAAKRGGRLNTFLPPLFSFPRPTLLLLQLHDRLKPPAALAHAHCLQFGRRRARGAPSPFTCYRSVKCATSFISIGLLLSIEIRNIIFPRLGIFQLKVALPNVYYVQNFAILFRS